MTYLDNIKNLIESDIVFQKKSRIHEENHKVNTYFEIGKLIVEAQGGDNMEMDKFIYDFAKKR